MERFRRAGFITRARVWEQAFGRQEIDQSHFVVTDAALTHASLIIYTFGTLNFDE